MTSLPSAPASPRRSRPGRPSGHFTQSERLSRLKKLLVKRPAGATLREIADHLGVTTRSARRYLKQLDEELPLQKVDGPGRAPYWRLLPQQRLRKVDLRRSQAYALLSVRPMFSVMAGSALRDDIEAAYESILDIAQRPFRGALGDIPPERLHERFVVLPEAPTDYADFAEDIDTFFLATAELRPVLARYLAGGRPDETVTIHPYALVVFQDAIWVIGRMLPAEPIKTIPLHELRDAFIDSHHRFELPERFDVLDYVDGGFGPTEATERINVTVDFDADVAPQVRIRPVHPTQKLMSLPGGAVRWSASVRELDRVRRWVLGFGPHARVVEPSSLRSQVIEDLKTALSLYRNRTV